jgi:hypothetical protein
MCSNNLKDFRRRGPKVYVNAKKNISDIPPIRGMIKRHLYLVPNSVLVSRGCPIISTSVTRTLKVKNRLHAAVDAALKRLIAWENTFISR